MDDLYIFVIDYFTLRFIGNNLSVYSYISCVIAIFVFFGIRFFPIGNDKRGAS